MKPLWWMGGIILYLVLSTSSCSCGNEGAESKVEPDSKELVVEQKEPSLPEETSVAETPKEESGDVESESPDGSADVPTETPWPEPPREPPHEVAQEDEVPPETPPDAVPGTCSSSPQPYTIGKDTVTVTCTENGDGRRSYTLQTTHPLRDNDPPSGKVTFHEQATDVIVRSGHLLFDALFALALDEVRQNSFPSVHEGAFDNDNPVACECFQTGKKWTWAWTRDTSYSVDLALAWVDPKRSQNTLLFKLSERKASAGGGQLQIVQDTGTGGSWPVSSDRVVWAMAAWKLASFLTPTERTAFLQKIYPALVNTTTLDRKVLYDANDGLYRGEQSFLDWREQSYPSWTRLQVTDIAMSKALSTNINHLVALQTTAAVAQTLGKTAEFQQYDTWAKQLQTAIHQGFYLTDLGLYSTMKTTFLDAAPVQKFDLLGSALAILFDVADPTQAAQVLARYPHSEIGAPVIWPQQPLIPIYHNRAIWPFVTAYWVRAARKVANDAGVTHGLRSLYRGAALNLSNMENMEFLTGANWYSDGDYSGPVVNSRRQLWSVAGYLAGVVDVLFGLQVQSDGLRFRPFVPQALHQEWFPEKQIRLVGFPYQGRTIDITLLLPTLPSPPYAGAYTIVQTILNGKPLTDDFIPSAQLQNQNTILITLAAPTTPAASIRIVKDNGDFRTFWSPKEPSVKAIVPVGGKLSLTLDSNGETGVVHNIYRDGVVVAQNIPTGDWSDPQSTDYATRSYCYSADSVFATTNNRSHHAPPVCWTGEQQQRRQTLPAWRFAHTAGTWGVYQNTPLIQNWGAPADTLSIAALRTHWTGDHLLQLYYRNPRGGSVGSGITCAAKRIRIFEQQATQPMAEGLVLMPQSDKGALTTSTLFRVSLDAQKTYRLLVDEPQEMPNMSYLQHFAIYTGDGGGPLTTNRTEIAEVRLWPVSGTDHTPTTGSLIALDGKNDLDKFPSQQVVTPGIVLESWERFAFTWDADWLYVAIVSKGFESGLQAHLLYLEAASAPLSTAKTSTGLTYLNLTSQLPFTPTHLIGVRQRNDNNDGFGPWNAIWRQEQGSLFLQTRLQPTVDYQLSADNHTISYRIHRAELGWPQRIRLSAHFLYGVAGNEWKDVVPATHTPWQSSTTGYYEIELGSNTASTLWQTR